MFTWICPKCGAEVPPHENDCPRCAKAAAPAPPAQPGAPFAPPPAPVPPLVVTQPVAVPQQPVYPPLAYTSQPQGYPAPSPLTSQSMPAAAPPKPQGGFQWQVDPNTAPAPAPQSVLGTGSGPAPPRSQGGFQWQVDPNSAPVPAAPSLLGGTPGPVPAAGTTAPWQVSPSAPPPQPQYAPMATAPTPPPPMAPPPAYLPPPAKSGLPSWAVVLIVAAVLIGAGYAGIRYMQGARATEAPAAATPGKFESAPAAAGKDNAHPMAKHLEITGFRVTEGARQRLQVRMLVVNHSAAELPVMKLNVNLRSTAQKPGDAPIATFAANLPSLGAFESIEVKTDTTTRLRAYEFPDWQFLKADFTVRE